MNEEKMNTNEEEMPEFGNDLITLTDEETGEELQFEVLATMTDEEVRSIIQPEMFLVCNLASIYDMDTLLDYLHKTRELGYVVDATSENPMFASSAAAPVRNLDGELVAAISIVIMHDPTNMTRVHELGRKTAPAALEISRALGFTGESVL